ncbi:GDSL esterase/lipase 2-like [Amaranthus tricolor]|uniref:GDSL esterase/lipase 2-like n=1 Tax=Amaranthus tricolor TaxID=29722 RepID=UPI00258A42BE|nr:GDSL esterase/lipase 2-like [Amaranthus tricolor]
MGRRISSSTNIFPKLAVYTSSLVILLCRPTISSDELIDKTPLFVFGDSLFDSGMTLYNGVEGAGAEFWPYGFTFFKKPAGRYSDGRVIPDFIAQLSGLPFFIRPYLLPGLDDYSMGVSFASASACVLVETRPGTINLMTQLYYFDKMVQKLKDQVGEMEGKRLLSKAVYLFNIGGNDYFSLFEENRADLPLSYYQKRNHMNMILGNLTQHINTIYKQGGRKFAFLNMGPMGCMPSMKFMLGYNGTCAEEPLDVARMHNTAFAALASRLEVHLPGFKYTIYDFFTSLHIRVLHGNSFGFKESETACCGNGPFNGGYSCQKKEHSFSVCSSPSDYLWFDAGHPTEKANEQFAKELWEGGPNIVAPYNLQTIFAMP